MKSEKNSKQQIACSVHDCKHCDNEENYCKLKNIQVCNCDGDGEKKYTMCNSYDNEEKTNS